MDYMDEFLKRLQKGERVEDIANQITKDINDANNKYIQEQEAKKKIKTSNSKEAKVSAVNHIICALAEFLYSYDASKELIGMVEAIDAQEIVDYLDECLPFAEKYIDAVDMIKEKHKKTDQDAIDEFLDKFIRGEE